MLLFDNLDSIKLERDSLLSIGAFDGVHRGHQQLIKQMLAEAHRNDRLAVVLTFHPHPNSVLFAHNPPRYLTTPGQKAVLLEHLGLDALVILPFDLKMAHTSAYDFVVQIGDPLRVRELWIGTDFALGRDREGDIPTLREIGNQLGFQVQVVSPYFMDGQVVSSTRIRGLLQDGRVEEAARLLNRYHSLAGEVVHGAGRGHQFGVPTANLQVRADRATLMNGIYAVWAILGTERYRAVANIGHRPSFDNGERTIEIHLLDFDKSIYGCDLLVEFVKWLRPEQRFESAELLYAQIERDVEEAKFVLNKAPSYPQPMRTEGCKPPQPLLQSKRFEELSYTADVGIRAFGQNVPALFENAARGMFSLMGDVDGLFDTTRHFVSISSPDQESLLLDWLGELLYLHDTTGEIFIRFEIHEISNTTLKADVYGTFLAQPQLEIKAVTYHDLSIEETPLGYVATVVFDI
jgi:riboflavin kinase/FMN adenylyltransferase